MMFPYKGASRQWRRWYIGCGIITLIGIVLAIVPRVGKGLEQLSYDLPFLFRGHIADTNAVVILEDRTALDALGEKQFPPSRAVHAKLLDRLREEGVKLVMFDIMFRTEKPGEDEILAAAIKRHGNVILGGVPEKTDHQIGNESGSEVVEIKPPNDLLRTNAAGWGLLLTGNLDSSFGVRKMMTSWKDYDAAIWEVAKRAGLSPDEKRDKERWINFYGPAPAMDRLSLGEVLQLEGRTLAPGSLRGKIAFVGFDSSVTPATGIRDLFATPYIRFGYDFSPGVEILANACMNLLNKNWLRRLPVSLQCLLTALFAIGSTALFIRAGKRWIFLAAPLLLIILFAVTLLLQWRFGYWWNWLVPAVIILPLTTLLAFFCPRLPVVAFISYRRRGGDDFALAVLHSLWARGYDAFLDVKDISQGEWLPQLREGIDGAPNFILVLSPNLFDRKEDEPDWVRDEILHAIARGKKIIPIQTKDFVYPDPLPQGMEQIPAQQTIIHHHDRPNATFDKLEEFLRNKKSKSSSTSSK